MAIQGNKLTVVDTVNPGDRFPLWSADSADWRGAPASRIKEYVLDELEFDDRVTIYSSPTTSGSLILDATDKSLWILLTPTNALSSMAITLPLNTSLADKQEVLFNTTQAITTLTVFGNGAGQVGIPASVVQFGFFRLRYDATNLTWYRVG